jgi:hypothetical protein
MDSGRLDEVAGRLHVRRSLAGSPLVSPPDGAGPAVDPRHAQLSTRCGHRG